MENKLAEYLKNLIKPRFTYGTEWDRKLWYAQVLKTFEDSLKIIKKSDQKEEPIPHNALLKLAVSTNQIKRNKWSFRQVNHRKLKEAIDLCKRFRVKNVIKATDNRLFDKPSKLEVVIDNVSRMAGEVHCRCCGRLLTVNISVKRGIGPICIKKTL